MIHEKWNEMEKDPGKWKWSRKMIQENENDPGEIFTTWLQMQKQWKATLKFFQRFHILRWIGNFNLLACFTPGNFFVVKMASVENMIVLSMFFICKSWQLTFWNGHTLNQRHAHTYNSFGNWKCKKKGNLERKHWKHTVRKLYDQHVLVDIQLDLVCFSNSFPQVLFEYMLVHNCCKHKQLSFKVFPTVSASVFQTVSPYSILENLFITFIESRKYRTFVFFPARCCLQIIFEMGYTSDSLIQITIPNDSWKWWSLRLGHFKWAKLLIKAGKPQANHLWKIILRLETLCLLFHGLYTLLYTEYFKVKNSFLKRALEACSFLQTTIACIYLWFSSAFQTRRHRVKYHVLS